MQYNGFISTLIERSEALLKPGTNDDLNVTRYLLVMNTGFALVHDRIRYWDDSNDKRVRFRGGWKQLEKVLDSSLALPVNVGKKNFFENFRSCADWSYSRLRKEHQRGALSGHNVISSLANAEERPIENLKLDSVVRALRNSFAHGGIMPMSPHQAGQRHRQSSLFSLGRVYEESEIDRVYFVSRWTGDDIKDVRGWIVLEFGLIALATFWQDWRDLLLASDLSALHNLDRAA